MKLLLDTCTFLWLLWDAPELSQRARTLFADPGNEAYLSVVSCWEIAVRYSTGKLPLPVPPERLVPEQREKHAIASLPLDEESALHVGRLPQRHRDPFDRMLISQAIVGGLVILTPDELIRGYPVRTTW